MKIQDYLSEKGVPFTRHEHRLAYTAQEVAAEEHVTGRKVAQPVIVGCEDGFAMCVVPADRRLDLAKAAEDELATMFPDAEIGAEAPFGSPFDLPTVVDDHLARHDEIVFQADSHREAIHMAFSDYEALEDPRIEDIALGD